MTEQYGTALNVYSKSQEQLLRENRLADIDSDFMLDVLDTSLENVLSTSMTMDYIRAFAANIREMKEDENNDDIIYDIDKEEDKIYQTMLEKFEDRFDINLAEDKEMLQTLYRFFLVDYTLNISHFLIMYLLDEQDRVVEQMKTDGIIAKSAIEAQESMGIPYNIAVIISNLKHAISIALVNNDMDFYQVLDIISTHEDASPSVPAMMDYWDRLMITPRSGNMLDILLQPLMDEQPGHTGVYTLITDELYSRFIDESLPDITLEPRDEE